MYDEYARALIDRLPDLPEMDRDACRRALSAAYFHVVRTRLGVSSPSPHPGDLDEVVQLLRRMADALESVAVFDGLHGVGPAREVEEACAFVAGEALALMRMLEESTGSAGPGDPLLYSQNYVAVEAALLYMIGGYDINALAVVQTMDLPRGNEDEMRDGYSLRVANSFYALRMITALCRGEVGHPGRGTSEENGDDGRELQQESGSVNDHIRSRLYREIGRGVAAYLDWLGGYERAGMEVAVSALRAVREDSVPSDYVAYSEFADIYHLTCLLLAATDRTSQRSLVHQTPPPPDAGDAYRRLFRKYLLGRARGRAGHRGRPFLWPSSLRYVRECLSGGIGNTVVSMPTGSGKGFVAELAITHALSSGWVLYLAPTNALAHQIRRDLRRALRPLDGVSVRAFVGGEEYTTLSEEQIRLSGRKFVAVMTPEKCALALRLYRARFADCSLCVFDECHLLSSDDRGVTADVVLAELSAAAPRIRFVLMSAMIGNPDDLAEWLGSLHMGASRPLTLQWRPCRTMRGLLVLDKHSLDSGHDSAMAALQRLPGRRVRQRFTASLGLIAGLSGPWTMGGPADYRSTQLPVSFEAYASRRSAAPEYKSWKNTSARALAEYLATSGIPVICFVLSSRHHAFSGAEAVSGALMPSDGFPPLVEAWLSIADAELGVETTLWRLLRRGVAVYTSAMLQPEQAASEWMFANRKAPLMLATGTLAEGLNLPAVGVVIAGTSLGDPRSWRTMIASGSSRGEAFILNAFGRAGRPGFSNQGLAVLVSDEPYAAELVDRLAPVSALRTYSVLGEPGAAVEVHSPIERFLDSMMVGDFDPGIASESELALTSLLAEYDHDDHDSAEILSRTLAAYHKRQQFTEDARDVVRARIGALKEEFLEQPGVPAWMNSAAMKAGVGFFRAWRVWQAYEERGPVTIEEGDGYSVEDWLRVLFEVLALLPPRRIAAYLPIREMATRTVLTEMRALVAERLDLDAIPWDAPTSWATLWDELMGLVLQYMQGAPYSEIAAEYLSLSEGPISNSRSSGHAPIPKVLRFVRDTVDRLAVDAGCLLAVHEFVIGDQAGHALCLPESVQALPLCIRNGCNSLGALSWYRFGYRQRVCAHALQRVLPVPEHLSSDGERARWVRRARHEWLAGGRALQDESALRYARTAILASEAS